MRLLSFVVIAILLLSVLVIGGCFYYEYVANPRVTRELLEDPDGERAEKVMLLTLPSGRRLPVNYLREGDRVYAGADGRWWKELEGEARPVRVLLRGEALTGRGRAVLDDPGHTRDVFSRLRPNALPGFGTLVEIVLDGGAPAP